MYSISFTLKNPKSRKPLLIYMFVFHHGERFKLSTKQRVLRALWDQKKRTVTRSESILNKYRESHPAIDEQLLVVKQKIDNLRSEVERFCLEQTLKQVPFSLPPLHKHLLRVPDTRNWGDVDMRTVPDFLQLFIKQIRYIQEIPGH